VTKEESTEAAPELEVSVVAPVYNEVDNLRPLYERVAKALDGRTFELVLVDDGSKDGSTERIVELSREDPRVRGLFHPTNYGQSAAMAAGIQDARGAWVATLDADLQNDPADLPLLLKTAGEHDACVGFRAKRNDTWVRRVSSKIANGVRNRLTGDHVTDTGCSLKVFRREAIQSIPFFEGMHRFMPTLLRWHGFSVVEQAVSHHPRAAGESKYGIGNRALPAFIDLMAVRWMRSRIIKPNAAERAPRPR